MTITQKILYEAATKGIVPKPALLMLSPSRETVWHKLRRTLNEGWTQEETWTVNGHKMDFIKITREGLLYLRDQCGETIPWAPYLEIPQKIKIMGSGYSRTEIATTYSRSVMAAVMADLAGTMERVMTHQTGMDDPLCLHRIISDAMENYEHDLKSFPEGETVLASRSDIDYIDGLSMKRLVEESIHGDGLLYDIRAGRMAGMIHTSDRSFLVYVISRDNTFTWDSKLFTKEKTVYREILRQRYGETTSPDQLHGILMIDSADTLKKAFFSRETVLQGRKPGRRFGHLLDFGSGLASMTVVPMTYEGAITLREVITEDADLNREVLTKALIEPQVFEQSDRLSPSVFPLQDPVDKTQYAVEPGFDLVRVRKLKALVRTYTRFEYNLHCYKRDAEFFTAIAPEIPVWDYLDRVDMGVQKPAEFAVEKEARLLGL